MISETLLYPDGFSKKKKKTAHKVTLKNEDSINKEFWRRTRFWKENSKIIHDY